MGAPWLDMALEDLGTREIAGPKHNPTVVAYFRDAGHPEVKNDETAWCAGFTGAMLARSGLPLPDRNTNLLARSYVSYGTACEPKPGAIGIWPRGAAWQGHVGIVVDVDRKRGTCRLLGGNQGNAVSIQTYKIKEALAFRWPPVAAEEPAKELPAPPPRPQPVAEAVRSSRTIFGVLAVFAATLVDWFKDAVDQIALFEPVKQIGSGLGLNLTTIVFGVTVAGLALALFARLDDAHKGRIVK